MKDIRWSYDSRTGLLDVWDSKNGRISHFDRCGFNGYEFCAQGRVIEINQTVKGEEKLHSIDASIYGDRPIESVSMSKENAQSLREEAKRQIELHYEPYPVHWQLTF